MADATGTSSGGVGSGIANAMQSAGHDPENAQELTVFVQRLLQQMQTRFQTMSSAIISRIDDMGKRIDDLEKSIGDLMTQAGIDEEESKGVESAP